MLHLKLLEFVAAENDEFLWPMTTKQDFDKLLAERAGAARDENDAVIPGYRVSTGVHELSRPA